MANPSTVRPGDFNPITQAGLKAHDLGTSNKAAIEPRLGAGCLDALAQDLTALGVAVPGAKAKRSSAKAATRTQDEVLAEGYALVSAVRSAVHKKAPKDVQAAYGVGRKVDPKVVKHVLAAIQLIVERATANPAEAAALGILSKDVQTLQADAAAIASADLAQEKERAQAPQTTKARNQIAARIVEAVVEIATAGALEFAKQADKRAEFDALLAAVATTRAAKKKSPPK